MGAHTCAKHKLLSHSLFVFVLSCLPTAGVEPKNPHVYNCFHFRVGEMLNISQEYSP